MNQENVFGISRICLESERTIAVLLMESDGKFYAHALGRNLRTMDHDNEHDALDTLYEAITGNDTGADKVRECADSEFLTKKWDEIYGIESIEGPDFDYPLIRYRP